MKHFVYMLFWVLLIGILFWIVFLAPGVLWTGGLVKELPVRVVRSSDRQPVAGVGVLLLTRGTFERLWALDQPERSDAITSARNANSFGVTDQEGRVTLCGLFPAGGRNPGLMLGGSYGIRGEIGVITETAILTRAALETILPNIKRSLRDELPEIELTLDHAP